MALWVLVLWLQAEHSSDHGEDGKQDTLDRPWWLCGNYHVRVFAEKKYRLEETGYAREFTDLVSGGKPRGQYFLH